MRPLPYAIRTLLAIAATLTAATAHAQSPSAPTAPRPGARADSIPADPWVGIYFSGFDRAARAAGLAPLHEERLPAGEREVRLWTQLEIGIPKELYRFVERGSGVRGELIRYWGAHPPDTASGERAGETTDDLMRYKLRGQCDGFAVAEETGVCRALFVAPPAWDSVLRAMEAEGLWTIPDPSTLPTDGVMVFDGWTIVVELRDGARYRTYRYNSPDLHPSWPSAARVEAIARALGAIDAHLAPVAARQTYRGVTTGAYRSAFEVCGDTATWEFGSELRGLAANAPSSVRTTLPAGLTDTTARDSTGRREATRYTIEIEGELTPEWLARHWESRYARVLQPYRLRAARRGVAADCRRVARQGARDGGKVSHE